MMKVSTKGRYALRLMIDVAQNGKAGCLPLKEIAERQDISMKYLEQIVSKLAQAGLLQSVRGAQGGYKLSRAPEDISAGEILRAAEGSLAPVTCVVSDCERRNICAAADFWAGMYSALNQYADGVRLSDFLPPDEAIS